MKFSRLLALLPALALACAQIQVQVQAQERIERLDPALDAILDPAAKVETLCQGFTWAEGPVWDERNRRLLFSDVPENTVYQWQEGDTQAKVYLKPSGFSGVETDSPERGANGLALDAQGRLVLCEHGDRRVAVITKNGGQRTIADNYNGKRFHSPNDLAIAPDGSIYFTDPPYGLPGRDEKSPDSELPFCGVYRVTPQGVVSLITRDLVRPNGVALSPDAKTLFIAQSHGPAPIVMAYPLLADGSAGPGRIFFNAKDLKGPGGPDGIKVDSKGNVFCTGPGGVLILDPAGKLLGRILCDRPTANVAFGEHGTRLYITSKDRLLRVGLRK